MGGGRGGGTRREPLCGIAQFVEKGVSARLKGAEALEWGVAQELGHQVNGLWRGTVAEHFCPGMGLDLGELEVRVVGVHRVNLLTRGRANNLDDLNQLVHV